MALAGHRPKGRRFCVTKGWATITPESAEDGDYADSGTDYDDKPFSRLSDVVRAVKDEGYWARWSSAPAGRPWDMIEAEPEQDYHTGETIERGLIVTHCDGLPLRYKEAMFLHRRLELNGKLIPERDWNLEVATTLLYRRGREL